MNNVYLRVKGIIKQGGKYLVVKRWTDDRIPDPYVWEFVEGVVHFGESPDEAMLRQIMETLKVDGVIDRILYTWNSMLGDTQCVGIAYLCHLREDEELHLTEEHGGYAWIDREEFGQYIDNLYVLQDLEGVEL